MSPAPASFSEISVLAPDSECRIFSSAFGSTAIGVASWLAASPAAPYSTAGTRPVAARPPRLVLAERVPRRGFEYRFHHFPHYASDAQRASNLYTNNEETDVSS